MTQLGRISVFFSYAHEDEEYREALVDHLQELVDERAIGAWHDRLITPSTDWAKAIETNLERAHIVLFLISPDFMRSNYCMGVEVKRALELHWHQRLRIVPVMLRPTQDWTKSGFGSFQALPRDAKPISTWKRPEAAFLDVVEGIRAVCKDTVDWENPLRRANVGDWVEIEQTFEMTAQRHTNRTRIVVVERDGNSATFALSVMAPQPLTMEITVSLDEPLEGKFGEVLAQFGEHLSANSQFMFEEVGSRTR